MSAQTRCPMCGGPIAFFEDVRHSVGENRMVDPPEPIPTTTTTHYAIRTTAADPEWSVTLSPETIDRLRTIADDWGKTISEVAEGAITEGISAWEEQDKRNREAGITVERVHRTIWIRGTNGAE